MNGQDESDANYDGIIMQVGKEVDLGESHLQLHDNNMFSLFVHNSTRLTTILYLL